MTNWTSNEGSVRMSLFKPSGKWYEDRAVDMSDYYYKTSIHRAVYAAYRAAGYTLHDGWMLVVLEPYHMNTHPVMLVGGRNYD